MHKILKTIIYSFLPLYPSFCLAFEGLETVNTLTQKDAKNCLVMLDVTNVVKKSPLPTEPVQKKKKLRLLAKEIILLNQEIKSCLDLKTIIQIVSFGSYDEYAQPNMSSIIPLVRFSLDSKLARKLTDKTSELELEKVFVESNP